MGEVRVLSLFSHLHGARSDQIIFLQHMTSVGDDAQERSVTTGSVPVTRGRVHHQSGIIASFLDAGSGHSSMQTEMRRNFAPMATDGMLLE
jgi:lipopolysaccharide export system protein LptA